MQLLVSTGSNATSTRQLSSLDVTVTTTALSNETAAVISPTYCLAAPPTSNDRHGFGLSRRPAMSSPMCQQPLRRLHSWRSSGSSDLQRLIADLSWTPADRDDSDLQQCITDFVDVPISLGTASALLT
jgi:hypothetical protein